MLTLLSLGLLLALLAVTESKISPSNSTHNMTSELFIRNLPIGIVWSVDKAIRN